jgi:hypothetical protein
MGCRAFVRVVLALFLASLLVCGLAAMAGAQGIQQSPYSAANTVRSGPFGGLDLAPSNPFGQPTGLAPAGPQSLYVSDGMLRAIMPLIPNLQFGYLYDFGSNRVNTGRLTADYLLPLKISANSEVFGEAHSEFENFWNTLKSTFSHGNTTTYENGFNNRVDLSFGGGYRTFLRRDTLVGINGFYDTSRLGEIWYSSSGLGLEMAALVGENDAIDLNFNWYGKLFNGNVILNAFRHGPSNFDFQAGYSHELWNGGPDLRLSATGYKFDIGEGVYGWNAGAELKTRDNMFILKYAVGNDKVDRTYQTVGGFVNVGFQLEDLFSGKSPFTKPEPIFHSPRNLRYMLTQKVRRNWHQPAAMVLTRHGQVQSQGPGECANLDRFFASVNMVPQGGTPPPYFVTYGTASNPNYYPFPDVPYTCLDPTKSIVLEFDYTFSGAGPSDVFWQIAIANAGSPTVGFGFFNSLPATGHFQQTFAAGSQLYFTSRHLDPGNILIQAFPTPIEATAMTISNVVIHFNQ